MILTRRKFREIYPGHVYGRLTVIAECERPMLKDGKREFDRFYFCQCECGDATFVRRQCLLKGASRSCGCLAIEILVKRSRTHGHGKAPGKGSNGTRTYTSWTQMRQRCLNPNHTFYKHYGGRGIGICQRWLESFQNFLDDMGERPPNTSLDRIDPEKGYSLDNCRWADRTSQGRNKRTNLTLTFQGITLCASEWAERTGLSKDAIVRRARAGWPVDLILTTPARVIKRKGASA